MDVKKNVRISRNYLALRGTCSFDAQNVIACVEEGGTDKECRRYVSSFRLCVLDEWCHEEKLKLQTCIDKNRAKMGKGDLKVLCTPMEKQISSCMDPRLKALE